MVHVDGNDPGWCRKRILGGSLVLDTEWHNGQWASPWLRELGYCHWESPWSPWNLVLEEPGPSVLSSFVRITWRQASHSH